LLLYFARHGESEANRSRTFSNRDLVHPLTALGRSQAERLAERLEAERIAAIYASPVLRARQTAEIVGARLGLPFELAEGLREYDVGEWEGTNAEEGWQEYRDVLDAWRRDENDRRVSTGESLAEIVARFATFLGGLRDRHDAGDRVLLIGHGGLFHVALPAALANVDIEFALRHPLQPADLVVAESWPSGWRCVRWAGESPGT
jgi:broad specificity phosphatase PhoE